MQRQRRDRPRHFDSCFAARARKESDQLLEESRTILHIKIQRVETREDGHSLFFRLAISHVRAQVDSFSSLLTAAVPTFDHLSGSFCSPLALMPSCVRKLTFLFFWWVLLPDTYTGEEKGWGDYSRERVCCVAIG